LEGLSNERREIFQGTRLAIPKTLQRKEKISKNYLEVI